MTSTPKPIDSHITQPFPGLRPYLQEEAEIFFGRGVQISRMLERLENNLFLAVVGSSGSGKSSLVRAGLLPALLEGYLLDTGTDWHFLTIRPGDDPFNSLAKECVDRLSTDQAQREDDIQEPITKTKDVLKSSPKGFLEVIEQADIKKGTSVLLLVDQFEEIFRFCANSVPEDLFLQDKEAHNSRNQAKAFVNLLLTTVKECSHAEPRRPLYVVITMRSDFIGRCESIPDLPQAVSDSQFLVPLMTRNQMQEAIQRPLQKFGWNAEPTLVNAILNDAGSKMDQLPLMQHALMRTWFEAKQRCVKGEPPQRVMTCVDYDKCGGLSKALSNHLDQAYDALNKEDQRVTQSLFMSLCERNNEGQVIRRPVSIREAAAVANVDPEIIIKIVREFQKDERNFIVVSPGGNPTPESLLDISHEALLRQWGKLKEWFTLEMESAEGYKDYLQKARSWKNGTGELLSGLDLIAARIWYESLNNRTDAWGERYRPNEIPIGASTFRDVEDLLEKSQHNEQAKKKAQIASENRFKHLSRSLGLVCVGLIGSLGAVAYINSTFTKSQEKLYFRSATNAVASDPDNSLILGLASLRAQTNQFFSDKDPRIAVKLIHSFARALQAPIKTLLAKTEQGQVWSLLQLKNGDFITAGADGSIKLWKRPYESSSLISVIKNPSNSQVLSLLLLDAERTDFISGESDGSLMRWEWNDQDKAYRSTWKKTINLDRGTQAAVLSMTKVSPSELAVAGSNGSITRWRTDGTLIREDQTTQKPIRALVPIPETRDFYSAGDDGIVRRWRDGVRGQEIIKTQDAIKGLVRLKTGDLITGNVYGYLQRWNPETGERLGESRQSDQGSIRYLFVLNQRDDIVSSGTAGTISIWNNSLGLIHGPIGTGQGTVYSLSPYNEGFIAAGSSGSIVRWILPSQVKNEFTVSLAADISYGIVLRNGDFLTSSEDGRLQQWNINGIKPVSASSPEAKAKGPNNILFISELTSGNIVTKTRDKTLFLWDRKLRPIPQAKLPNDILAFSELYFGDILTVSTDGTLRHWGKDFASGGEPIGTIKNQIFDGDKDQLLMLSMRNGDTLIGGKGEIIQIKSHPQLLHSTRKVKPQIFRWRLPKEPRNDHDNKTLPSNADPDQLPNITSLIELQDGSVGATTSEGHAIGINIDRGEATVERIANEPLTSMAQYSDHLILIGSKDGYMYAWTIKNNYLNERISQKAQRYANKILRPWTRLFIKSRIDHVITGFSNVGLIDKMLLGPSMPSLDILSKQNIYSDERLRAISLVDDTVSVRTLRTPKEILMESCEKVKLKIEHMKESSDNKLSPVSESKRPSLLEMDSTSSNRELLAQAASDARDFCQSLKH